MDFLYSGVNVKVYFWSFWQPGPSSVKVSRSRLATGGALCIITDFKSVMLKPMGKAFPGGRKDAIIIMPGINYPEII